MDNDIFVGERGWWVIVLSSFFFNYLRAVQFLCLFVCFFVCFLSVRVLFCALF